METYSEYLQHHGILGMRWGKRNGPPYPLSRSKLSYREKRLRNDIPDAVITKPAKARDRWNVDKYKIYDLRVYKDLDFPELKENAVYLSRKVDDDMDDYSERIDDMMADYAWRDANKSIKAYAFMQKECPEQLKRLSSLSDYPKEDAYGENRDLYEKDRDDVKKSFRKFLSGVLDNDDSLKKQQLEIAKEAKDASKAVEWYVNSIVGKYGDYPVSKKGYYSDIKYRDLVEKELSKSRRLFEYGAKALFSEDSMPPVSKYLTSGSFEGDYKLYEMMPALIGRANEINKSKQS